MTTVAQTARRSRRPRRAGTRSPTLRAYCRSVRGGDMGALPAVAGLVVLVIIFSMVRPVFFTALQLREPVHRGRRGHRSSPWAWSSCCCSARSTCRPASPAASARRSWPCCWTKARQAVVRRRSRVAIVTGVAIGLTLGTLVAKVGIPSFVVTLAAFLAFQGVLLLIVNEGTIVSIPDPVDPGHRATRTCPRAGLGAVVVVHRRLRGRPARRIAVRAPAGPRRDPCR